MLDVSRARSYSAARALLALTAVVTACTPKAAFAANLRVDRQAAPTPTAAPTASAAPRPSPQPTVAYTRYLAADLALAPEVTNGTGPPASSARASGQLRGALEYRFLGRNFAEIESHDWSYAVAAKRAYERQTTLDTSIFGVDHVFLATSSLLRTNSYGAPRLGSTFGFGLEALPDFERSASLSGSLYYDPDVDGKVATPIGPPRIAYKLVTYQLNAALTNPGRPLFLEIGAIGDHFIVNASAPSAQSHRALHLGVGAHV